MLVNYLVSKNTVTLYADGRPVVLNDPAQTQVAIKMIKQEDMDGLYEKFFVEPTKVENKDKGVEVRDSVVFVNGRSLPNLLSGRIIEYTNLGLSIKPLVEFAKRLYNNPSNTAVMRLFECLDHNHHPICEDGRFLAWKRVRGDFKDIYSGKFDNSPGKTPSVNRNEVDEDMDKTCSHGLHVASFEYASRNYGSNKSDVLLEVLVDPADVVAIPRDYNNQKMRTCGYEVVQVCKEERTDRLVTATGETSTLEADDDYDWDGLASEDEEDDYYDYDEDDDECCTDCECFVDDCECDDEDEEEDEGDGCPCEFCRSV